MMWRVSVGAFLSVGDMITDLVVLKRFWDAGEATLAYKNAQLASLMTSLGLQLIMVFCQNRKKGIRRIMQEMLIVLIGLKAPLDAFRVASGADHENGLLLDPMTEMTFSKCIEMSTESIPGIIIQTTAILSTVDLGGTVHMATFVSLFVSVLTTGFISATLSYDMDTDPKKRAYNPEFYGYVPDGSRTRALLFCTMILISSVQVLLKAVVMIVFGMVDLKYAVYYLIGDLVFFLTVKLFRKDFLYWVPLEGGLAVLCSVFARGLVKLIVDFSGVMVS